MPKPPATTEQIKQGLLTLLPRDGTPVLNRVMRSILARDLERPIREDTFFAARDDLFVSGLLGRLSGQGGQVFLSGVGPQKPQDASFSTDWPERNLMVPLRRYLEGPFRKELDVGDGAVVVHDTSALGGSGRWARPDFILVSAMRFKILPGCQVDVHAFELKTEDGGGVLAVHEALAQTRFTNFGHLVWHLPEGSKAESLLDTVATHAREHGIGLIRMRDPLHAASTGCEILLDPQRKATSPPDIDGFLETRLTPAQRQAILSVTGKP